MKATVTIEGRQREVEIDPEWEKLYAEEGFAICEFAGDDVQVSGAYSLDTLISHLSYWKAEALRIPDDRICFSVRRHGGSRSESFLAV